MTDLLAVLTPDPPVSRRARSYAQLERDCVKLAARVTKLENALEILSRRHRSLDVAIGPLVRRNRDKPFDP
jgi:hypothetical protein